MLSANSFVIVFRDSMYAGARSFAAGRRSGPGRCSALRDYRADRRHYRDHSGEVGASIPINVAAHIGTIDPSPAVGARRGFASEYNA
jgi:hypothetical protein